MTASPVPPAALGIVDVSRRIGHRDVVDHVSLDLADGELLALVGPSGCGKSTLLRIIAGLDTAASGRIVLAGQDVTAQPPERRRIGLVFQDHALFPHRNVARNIAFGLRHLDRQARVRRVDELLELVRLPGVGQRFPHELSGGEQQRIALARALAPDPSVVLLDEPFASLDPSLRDDVRNDVVAALRARCAAAILVTHDRDEALALGDRIAVMSAGRVLQTGRPADVYERPADRFVAQFLGPVSFLTGSLTGRSGAAQSAAMLVARPHHLRLTSGGSDTVVSRRYLGAAWRYEVRRPDGDVLLVDAAPAPGGDLLGVFDVGAACTVTVDPAVALHRLLIDPSAR